MERSKMLYRTRPSYSEVTDENGCPSPSGKGLALDKYVEHIQIDRYKATSVVLHIGREDSEFRRIRLLRRQRL